jgi:hypothetical protein
MRARSHPELGLLLAGCAVHGYPAETGSPQRVEGTDLVLDAACDPERRYGGFTVEAAAAGSYVEGRVADGVLPADVPEVVLVDGACRLQRRPNPFCDPTCAPGTACAPGGSCVAYPLNQDLGTLTLAGLGDDVVLDPVVPGSTYAVDGLPAIEEGAGVALDMPAGVYGPALLHGLGVGEIVSLDSGWSLDPAEDLEVRWEPPAIPDARATIAIRVAIDVHGATPGTLHCDLEDTGSASISSTIVAGMIESGVTGFPSAFIERRSADSAPAGAGCMDLLVRSSSQVPVDVVGHTPCTGDEDCPAEQDCDEAMQTCVGAGGMP